MIVTATVHGIGWRMYICFLQAGLEIATIEEKHGYFRHPGTLSLERSSDNVDRYASDRLAVR